MNDIYQYLTPIDLAELADYEDYYDGQLGKHIDTYTKHFPDIHAADIIVIGIADMRGDTLKTSTEHGPNLIRKQLFSLHYWHKNIKITDIGNVITGASLKDTYAAAKIILTELYQQHKTVLIIGGSHDLMLAQYAPYQNLKQRVDATCIDSTIDISMQNPKASKNFLLEMLTGVPNFIRHYNHIGFQSYFMQPHLLETIDKLRFDCFRLGTVSEKIEEMEPVLRSSHIVSFDINALKYSDAPTNTDCPNGLTGVEACTLTKFAGMSASLNSLGIYGYNPTNDVHNLTAKQIAQMIWYFIDGKNRAVQESSLLDKTNFNEYHCSFTDIDTTFLQSKKTARWWMQLPNKDFIACTYSDYLMAIQNEIPERWLRAQERIE